MNAGRPKGENKIDKIKLIQLIRDNKTHKQCAEHFGVSIWAVKHALKTLRGKLENPPVLKEGDLYGDNIDSMGQLKTINSKIMEQLNRCDKMINREEVKMEALNAVEARVKKAPHDIDAQEILAKIWGNNLKSILAIQSNIINVSAEVRKQIELQVKIAETLYSIQVMQEFQSEIINLLREVDSITAQKLINKLKERRTIRGLVKMIP